MDDDKFWEMVEEGAAIPVGECDKRDELIRTSIGRLSVDEALSFYQIFNRLLDTAFTWSLWGAAYVINGGCGDDSFMDFRASLISRGRAAFNRALADPDSLADDDIDIDSWFHEGFQYAVADGVKASIGRRPLRDSSPPSSLSGLRWSEASVRELYPRLVRRMLSVR